METLICELLKKEFYITYSRRSGPTPDACTLGVHIKHADDPEKNSVFIHRLLFCSKLVYKACYLLACQYQTEQVIHDIIINFFFSNASAAVFGTVKFFSYVIILDNYENSAEHPNSDGVSQ